MPAKRKYDTPYEQKVPEESRRHFRAAREEFRKSMEGMIPPAFLEHRRRARREMLLAWRSMIDARLSRLDREEAEDLGSELGGNPDIVK